MTVIPRKQLLRWATPQNLHIGSYDGNATLVPKPRKPYIGSQTGTTIALNVGKLGKQGEDFPYVSDLQ